MKTDYKCEDCKNSKKGSVFKQNPKCSKCWIDKAKGIYKPSEWVGMDYPLDFDTEQEVNKHTIYCG